MIYPIHIHFTWMVLNIGFEYLFPQYIDIEKIENHYFPNKILLSLFIYLYLFLLNFDNLPN